MKTIEIKAETRKELGKNKEYTLLNAPIAKN